ncbi:hypothetical protein DS885_06985 [Psychromonas sp. B3M02]|uniref:DUF202 domain-containing protein n=1 Tax=Psychromonas sp. B3M02 TaxID=2267226 RepID=UPI000DE80EC3|nr:DUF202 domain-containing protein [Psychromonas sp. B3M02]RBW46684.1 hypothetical protein DS885_06985 [Psychromonas sp. B3M02]
MNSEIVDHGLQPERTLMSWFRTYFLLIIVSFVLLFVSAKLDLLLFKLAALCLIVFTILSLILQIKRFKHYSPESNTVNQEEVVAKVSLSCCVALMSLVYAVFLLMKIVSS